MLKSSSLVKDSRKQIQKKLINAEAAIEEELKKHEQTFKNLNDDYFRERFDDVEDICKICDLQLSERSNMFYNKMPVLIAGFRDYTIEKYVQIIKKYCQLLDT